MKSSFERENKANLEIVLFYGNQSQYQLRKKKKKKLIENKLKKSERFNFFVIFHYQIKKDEKTNLNLNYKNVKQRVSRKFLTFNEHFRVLRVICFLEYVK